MLSTHLWQFTCLCSCPLYDTVSLCVNWQQVVVSLSAVYGHRSDCCGACIRARIGGNGIRILQEGFQGVTQHRDLVPIGICFIKNWMLQC